jgi:hypothetical protein
MLASAPVRHHHQPVATMPVHAAPFPLFVVDVVLRAGSGLK